MAQVAVPPLQSIQAVVNSSGVSDFKARLNLLQQQGMPRTSGSRLMAQMFFGSYFGSVARVVSRSQLPTAHQRGSGTGISGLDVVRPGAACARWVLHGPRVTSSACLHSMPMSVCAASQLEFGPLVQLAASRCLPLAGSMPPDS